ncbi:MAG: hypothetical protein ACLTSL_01750 [Odoribacter splanchnicus]
MKTKMLILFLFMAAGVAAQDVIVKKNGDEIQAKVLTVSGSEVGYKKWSNQEGPTYTLSRQEIFMIKYINGDKDVFNTDVPSTAPKSAPGQQENPGPQNVVKSPAANNAELVRKYSPEIRIKTKPSDKDAKWFFPIMAVADSSVLATEDIEVSIVPVTIARKGEVTVYDLRYYIKIKNKTDKPVYIDKANTFKIYSDRSYKTYFDAKQINIAKGGNSGIGINLGGVANVLGIGGTVGTLANATSVGGSSQSSVVKSYSQQRILAIPPHATANLSEFKQEHVKGKKYEKLSDAEWWSIDYRSRGSLKKGECICYNEKEAPDKYQYHITYSCHENFATYSTLNFMVYARYIVGEQYDWLQYKDSRLIEAIQKFVPDFWNNPYILVGDVRYIDKP